MTRISQLAWQKTLLMASLILLSACQADALPPRIDSTPWVYTDLRLLDEAGEINPGLDLVAGYTRSLGGEFQIRLDLLDLTGEEHTDLYLAIDSLPGGSTSLPLDEEAQIPWEILVVIPARGSIQILGTDLQPLPGTGIRVLRDPIFDTLILSLPRQSLPGNPSPQARLRLQAFTAESGKTVAADSLGPLSSSSLAPPRAPVILAFWNTLPAYTPLEILRRWDGAHTGPLGGRHGLYNLLRAVRNTRQPVFLLDLKSPPSLVALEYAGGTKLVHDLAESGILGLPEVLPGLVGGNREPVFPRSEPVLEQAAAGSRQAAYRYGLSSDGFLFAPEGLWPSQANASAIFVPVPSDQTQDTNPVGAVGAYSLLPLGFQAGRLLIPVPGYLSQAMPDEQATRQGPTLSLRKALVEAALQASPGNVLVLGGDLPATTWGDPQIARATLRYFKEHPWIWVMKSEELRSSRPASDATWFQPLNAMPYSTADTALDRTSSSLNGPALAAWQAYLALSSPTFPGHPDLPALRAGYTPLVDALYSAARWADTPIEQAACDLSSYCVLASQTVYAQFDAATADLVLLFVRTPSGVHQVIAPSAQLTTGQSDPSSWDLNAGLHADPAGLPGAFGGLPPNASIYTLGPTSIAFESSAGSRVYSLLPNGLQVDAAASDSLQLHIPLALDPWQRFTPGWTSSYQALELPAGWAWQINPPEGPSVRVSIHTQAPWSVATFRDSLPYMNRPEDPNRDYPAGHRLPFPLALLTLEGQDQITVQIEATELVP